MQDLLLFETSLGSRLVDRTDTGSWRPFVLTPADPRHAGTVGDLLASGRVSAVHDRIDDQVADLAECLDPDRPRDAEARAAAVAEALGTEERWRYGSWVWYPWSGRLVHVLPRDEFRLLRTARHHGTTTRSEQAELLCRRIAVIGLSVGARVALACARNGVGGAFRLADHGHLGLSDLDRMPAGVADLGVDRTVLCARRMYEIDPYLDVEIQRSGITEDTVDEFFLRGAGPLDLLVEESDAPWVTAAAREHARRLGIPVLEIPVPGASTALTASTESTASTADAARRVLLGRSGPSGPSDDGPADDGPVGPAQHAVTPALTEAAP